jgi:hypothetical protein
MWGAGLRRRNRFGPANLLGSGAAILRKFQAVNFSSEKSDIGFTLMNQLAVAETFPRSQRDAVGFLRVAQALHWRSSRNESIP